MKKAKLMIYFLNDQEKYKITYEQMKEWGYMSLVHEYYKTKKRGEKNGKSYCNVEI